MLQLPLDWHKAMSPFIQQGELDKLNQFLVQEYQEHTIYPAKENLLRAFFETPYNQAKAVILAQDPYHGPRQACGLAFAVPKTTKSPASLRNIIKELADDLQIPTPTSHDIAPWAKRGVLMLNTILSVRAHEPASHQNKGWEKVSDAAIQALSARKKPVVFILWGKFALDKKELIDTSRHACIEAPHPSPLAAYKGFFGSKPFSKTNQLLKDFNQDPIDWSIIPDQPNLFQF